jgi:hypothetical protein
MAPGRDPKVRYDYTVLCEQVILDKEGYPTVVRVLRNLGFPQLPGIVAQLGVLVGFSGPEGETYSVSIEDPKRRQIAHLGRGECKPGTGVQGRNPIVQTVFVCNVQNATFQTEGVHHIVLRVGDRVVHRDPFGVIVAQPQERGG